MKTKRQSKIIELINKNDIDTQDMLVTLLNNEGFNVTQATVSRDIKELKLSKVLGSNGKQKYGLNQNKNLDYRQKLVNVFNEAVISMTYAQNIIIIRTLNGMAMAVASAIDSMQNVDILGTIAGDDTIFSVVKSEEIAIKIIEKFRSIIRHH